MSYRVEGRHDCTVYARIVFAEGDTELEYNKAHHYLHNNGCLTVSYDDGARNITFAPGMWLAVRAVKRPVIASDDTEQVVE